MCGEMREPRASPRPARRLAHTDIGNAITALATHLVQADTNLSTQPADSPALVPQAPALTTQR